MGEPNARDRIDAMMECMGLDDPDRTWAALVDQQLVGNRRSVREAFEGAVRRAWTADGYPPNAAHDVAAKHPATHGRSMAKAACATTCRRAILAWLKVRRL